VANLRVLEKRRGFPEEKRYRESVPKKKEHAVKRGNLDAGDGVRSERRVRGKGVWFGEQVER